MFSATKNILLLSLRSKFFGASWSRKLGWESKKRGMSPEGEGRKENLPPPSFLFHLFCSRSNFRAISRCKTLATQANYCCLVRLAHRLPAVSRYKTRSSANLKFPRVRVSNLLCKERFQFILYSLNFSPLEQLNNFAWAIGTIWIKKLSPVEKISVRSRNDRQVVELNWLFSNSP